MSHAWIGLGSNLGNREQYLKNAASELSMLGGVRFASVYETDPIFPRGVRREAGRFLNTVCALETGRNVLDLFTALRRIEVRNQRVTKERFAPRSLDIDLLDFDRLCLVLGESEDASMAAAAPYAQLRLKLPHPRLHLRKFVLIPWCELDPLWMHPLLKRSITQLLESVADQSSVNLHCVAADLFL
ncbi:MAG TPA: 2-amino-4-hydroxy-6-hydroxymethyldihydropteridine diphosphokinase [Acidobacteriota bacterium]|jgi:2-amino-4-hydroxy-6-hydroxymethyldihydropteridine diphosphokinase